MAASLDLASLQSQRDREIRAGRAVVAERSGDLADKILAWANRADRARARLAPDDAEAAHSVERWCVRRLRGDARRVVGKAVPDSVKADVVGLCEAAFADRLRVLRAAADGVAK